MSISGTGSSGSSWTPSITLPNLQTKLNNVYQYLPTYEQSQFSQAESSILQSINSQAMPLLGQLGTDNSELTALQSLVTNLQSFQSAIQTLGTSSTWSAVTATSSNTSAATVAASSGAPQTNIAFSVTQQAQGQSSTVNLTSGSETAASNLSAGTVTITGTNTAQISVQAGESLSQLVSDINAQSSATNVQAGLIQKSSNTYQLMLSDSQTGSTDGAFSISTSDVYVDSGKTTLLALNGTIQGPQDAAITLGTGSGAINLTSQTNTFQNALPNVTLNIAGAGSGTISIASNSQAIVNSAQQMMTAYNNLEQMVYSPSGSLANTSIAQEIRNLLPNLVQGLATYGMVLAPGTYSESTSGQFQSTGSPQLEFQPVGGVAGNLPAGVSLTSGSTMLTDAIASNEQTVQSAFGTTSTGFGLPSGSILGQLSSQITLWLNDLNGTTVNNQQVSGEIANLQSSIGNSSTAVPGSIWGSLGNLNTLYNNQLQNLVYQWGAAGSAIYMAQQQLMTLQATQASSSSTNSVLSSLLGG